MSHSRRQWLRASAASVLGLSPFLRASQAIAAARRVSVADFGALPDGTDVVLKVRAAIRTLPKREGVTLYFPPGTYRFGATPEPALYFQDIDDLTLYGESCTLLFEDAGFPIVASDCKNIRVEGLTIDWKRPPFSQGDVIRVSDDGRSFDVQMDPGYEVTGAERFYALATFERETGLMSRGGIDASIDVDSANLIGRQQLKIALKGNPIALKPGETVVVRHRLQRENHAITFRDCFNVQVTRVRIHASTSMAVVGERCENVRIRELQVVPKANSGRLMSTNADAVHFANGRGLVEVTDCTFKGMGDDGINVHGRYLELVDAPTSRAAVVANKSGVRLDSRSLPRPGDRFVFVDALSLAPRGFAEISGVEPGDRAILHFKTDLPVSVKPGDLLCNVSARASLKVFNCRFPGNRARGILAHGDVAIERCLFSGQFEQAILLLPDTYWMEGCAAEHARIVDSEIGDAIRSQRRQQGAITIDAIGASGSTFRRSTDIVNHDIEISANRVFDSGGSAITANAVDNLTIRGNKFGRCASAALSLGIVRRVSVLDNVATPASVVEVDAKSRDQVSLQNNDGLS